MRIVLMRRKLSGMRNDWLEQRIEEMKPQGKSKKGLADALKLWPARITEIIAGRRELSPAEVLGIAHYLELPPTLVLAYATGGALRPAKLGQVWVKGSVQAGAWREAVEWPQGDWRPAPLSPDVRYSKLEQFGLEVVGPSMNEEYPEGSVVICVNMLELGRDPNHGDHVICRRRSTEGVEITIKEVRREADGSYWLWPRSRDPNFQQPWKLPQNANEANEDLTIIALVIGAYKPRP